MECGGAAAPGLSGGFLSGRKIPEKRFGNSGLELLGRKVLVGNPGRLLDREIGTFLILYE